MANSIKVVVFISVLLMFASCKKEMANKSEVNTNSTTTVKKEQLAVNLKKVSIDIEGMTCEIGCARMIQSKLSKVDGIKTANVNFEKKNGIVEFDVNQISEKEIVDVVEKIAGGDLYKIAKITAAE